MINEPRTVRKFVKHLWNQFINTSPNWSRNTVGFHEPQLRLHRAAAIMSFKLLKRARCIAQRLNILITEKSVTVNHEPNKTHRRESRTSEGSARIIRKLLVISLDSIIANYERFAAQWYNYNWLVFCDYKYPGDWRSNYDLNLAISKILTR